MTYTYSIRKRLLFYISISVIFLSLIVGSLSLYSAYEETGEIYDAQLAHSAKILLQLTEHEVGEHKRYEIELGTERPDLAHRYENKLTFRIWKDNLIVTKSHRAESFGDFTAPPGFSNQVLSDEKWRFFVFLDPQTNITIEVAEKMEVRRELIFKILASFWGPLFFFIPILLIIVWCVVSISLKPVITLSKRVDIRDSNDLTAIETDSVPLEIHPLIVAMNNVLERIQSSFTREQQFTDNAAHELRTPLAAMKTQTQVLIKKASHIPECSEGLDNLHKSIDRASRMVEQLLSFSRLQSGILEMDTVDLSLICKTIVDDLLPLATKKGITLNSEQTPNIPVSGNRHALEIVVKNLLDNAIKFSPEGSTVTVDLHSNNQKAVLTISDQGIGIPASERERVFERFYRVHKSKYQGSGLGLPMVHWVCDVHGADLALSENTPSGLSVAIEMDIAK